MIGIEVRFLAGRFHATGWNSAHNEGVPEWPPSPWRLLRALVSAGLAQGTKAELAPLLEKLHALPRYRLPRGVEGHLRHYMPDPHDANHKRTKIFDAFVAVEGGTTAPEPLTVAWPVTLTADERTLLERLCHRISYLGRAESWAELSVVDVADERWDCWPDEYAPYDHSTTLLALESPEALSNWAKNQPKPKKGADVPRTLLDVLTFDTERFRREGWSRVPGTRLTRYVFAAPPFRYAAVPRAPAPPTKLPTVARYAIRSAVLPRVEHAVAIGERLRCAAMSHSRKVSGDARPVFSGHGLEASGHRHAMYLCCSDDRGHAERGLIDHVLISARMGFEEEDVLALQRLQRVWGKGGHDLELILIGLGEPADYGDPTPPRTPVLAKARTWRSVTPFVPTRHPKLVRGVPSDTISDQIRRACTQLLGDAPLGVALVEDRGRWVRFRRRRSEGGGNRGPDGAFGARLTFENSVTGPIALGYGAHFGLGLFVPDTETEPPLEPSAE